MIVLNRWRFHNNYTKGGHLIKHPLGQMPTLSVVAGNISKEDSPCQPNPRRAMLASARKTIQEIRAMIRPVQKRHSWCMAPGNLRTIGKCLRTTPKGTLHRSHSKKSNTNPEATKAVPIPSSFKAK